MALALTQQTRRVAMPKDKGNDRYMSSMSSSPGKVMKNHGSTQAIKGDAQKMDMGKVRKSPYQYKGTSHKAFEYKF